MPFLKAFTAFAATVTNEHVFTEAELKEFTRRAHASVIILKILFTNESVLQPSKGIPSAKKFHTEMNTLVAKYTISQYKTLTDELKKVEHTHGIESKSAYDTALKLHNETVTQLISQATPVFIETKDELGTVISRVKTYPDLILPEFTFEESIALDESYLKPKISIDSWNILFEQGLDTYANFADLYTAINTKSKAAYETLLGNGLAAKGKKLKIGALL